MAKKRVEPPVAKKTYKKLDVSQLSYIPNELKLRPQWVCWTTEPRDGQKTGKPPINPNTGELARPNDLATWGTFQQAVYAFNESQKTKHPYYGVGYVFSSDDPYTGIDIDDCRINGRLTKEAEEIVLGFDTYTEVSPSGTGIKMIVRGQLPIDGTKRSKAEGYSARHYFTLTGDLISDKLNTINERQDQLIDFYQKYLFDKEASTMAQDTRPAPDEAANQRVAALTDDELIAKIQESAQGAKFMKLWTGDMADQLNDHSRADMALVSILAYWTRGDVTRMDRLFRRSKLMRPKWEREDYRTATLTKAIASAHAFYDPEKAVDFASAPKGVNDTALANLFVELEGENYAWNERRAGGWLQWSGSQWRRCEDNVMLGPAICVSNYLIEAALREQDTDTRVKKLTKAAGVGNRSRLEALLKIASGRLKVEDDRFDRRVELLSCLNGAIDLERGELKPAERGDWFMQAAPVAYDPKARAPQWEKFIRDIMCNDEELAAYFKRVLGYSLTGCTSERAFFILHGTGRNGKTTVVEVMKQVLGDLAEKVQVETFMKSSFARGGGEASPDVAVLHDKRFVWTTEASRGARFDTGKLKEHSGQDTIKARHMYQELFEFKPRYKIFFATNEIPQVREDTEAFWDRLHMIPFAWRIEKPIFDFQHKVLTPELPGILRWCVDGAVEWFRDGLQPPNTVKLAVEAERREQDAIFWDWYTERCAEHERVEIPLNVFAADFAEWCKTARGIEKGPGSSKLRKFLERAGVTVREGTGHQRRVVNLVLKKEANQYVISDEL